MATTRTAYHNRIAGWVLIVGTVTMGVGAGIGMAFGSFVDKDLDGGTFGDYLTHVAENRTAAQANLWLWIIGILMIGLGGVLISKLGNQESLATKVARFSFTAGPASAIVFYSMLLGVVVVLVPLHAAGENVLATATVIAWIGTTADWIATALVLGLGVAALAFAGRDTWVPRWLYWWAIAAGAAGVVSMIGTITGARETVSFVILPIAMSWMIAAGVVAIRYRGLTEKESSDVGLQDHPAAP
ncbi:MAG: hypothetical protein ACC658_12820 [Acidimicrobiia bacterium]